MKWVLLSLGIIAELCGSTCMKLSDGFSHLLPSVLTFVFYGASFSVFMYALKQFDLSVAYAVWAGMGIMLVSVIGMVYFREPVSMLKIAGIGIIIIGVIVLNMSDFLLQTTAK